MKYYHKSHPLEFSQKLIYEMRDVLSLFIGTPLRSERRVEIHVHLTHTIVGSEIRR